MVRDEITSSTAILLYFVDPRALADSQTETRHILFKVSDNLVAGYEAVRIVPPIFGASLNFRRRQPKLVQSSR